ncbi:TPA: hypothetical protein DEO28_05240 [Candidatus Dependentiae bacterium]|nr:MAG: hypothetical protein UR14_C0002G0159 [candidate division TM6 bacterium GW2011_GWE2_31_21]KKP53956.1 MAG: hypothetical protein UR43_C0002G0159 [candidate division TM6 bacterium GW2011_GWF2_33_332]HBS47736.1 hypothetical protein [Candidatus Dependentiae bacterium]HBZ73885.1 hypothetical protein [Candidatus Dependentiae bacterium]
MILFKKIILFLTIWLMSCSFILPQTAAEKSMETDKQLNQKDYGKLFGDELSLAKRKLIALKDFLTPSGIKNGLKSMQGFATTSQIKFATKENDGLLIDKGYFGAGNIAEPFAGLKVVYTCEGFKLFTFWEAALQKSSELFLEKMSLNNFFNIDPVEEFLLNFIFLSKDRFDNNINSTVLFVELNLLLYRYFTTFGDKAISSQFSKNSLFVEMAKSLQVKYKGSSKDLITFLDDVYKEVKPLYVRHFGLKLEGAKFVKDPDYIPDGSKLNKGQSLGLLVAIITKAFVNYQILSADYQKTVNGKAAYQKMLKAIDDASKATKFVDKNRMRLEALSNYSQGMPGFNDELINKFLVPEVVAIYGRLADSSLKGVIDSVLDSALAVFGLSLSSISGAINTAKREPEPPSANPQDYPEIGFDPDQISLDSF